MTQQLFDDLTADAPPSTVDVRGIIRRERRRRAFVRAGVPGLAVLAAASAVAVLGHGPASAPAPGPAVVAAAPSISASPPTGFRLVASNKAAAAATAESLRAALDAAVRKAAPGATWLSRGNTGFDTPNGQPPRITGDGLTRTVDQMFTGTTGLGFDGRKGKLSINIISMDQCTGGALTKCAGDQKSPKERQKDLQEGLFACQPKAVLKCTASTGPDGRRQRVQTSTSLHGFVSQETNVELADGRALMIAVDNEFVPPGGDPKNDIPQPGVTPLSPAQVTTIATTIGDQILP